MNMMLPTNFCLHAHKNLFIRSLHQLNPTDGTVWFLPYIVSLQLVLPADLSIHLFPFPMEEWVMTCLWFALLYWRSSCPAGWQPSHTVPHIYFYVSSSVNHRLKLLSALQWMTPFSQHPREDHPFLHAFTLSWLPFFLSHALILCIFFALSHIFFLSFFLHLFLLSFPCSFQ